MAGRKRLELQLVVFQECAGGVNTGVRATGFALTWGRRDRVRCDEALLGSGLQVSPVAVFYFGSDGNQEPTVAALVVENKRIYLISVTIIDSLSTA